jgi:hypothetical protein
MANAEGIRGIVIAGNESALLNAVETEAARRAGQYALAVLPNRFSGDKANTSAAPSGRLPLDWNPGSPISARTLVLAAENRLVRVDEAILVCDPPFACRSIDGLSLADVEVLANDHVKSWYFLVKELAAVFKTRGAGIIALVYPEMRDEAADLLGSTAVAVFRSLSRSFIAGAANEPYFAAGFSGGETGDEAGFASFIFKHLDEKNRRNNGKIFKYGKLALFR